MTVHVCIIQPVIKGYRLPFFTALSTRLANAGVTLEIVYAAPWENEKKRGDHVDLDASLGKKVSAFMLFERVLVMPVLRPWWKADLIIVEHANKHLLNYLLALLQILRIKRVAYWGHGCDRQADTNEIGEKFKRRSLHWADWWFAYTEGAAKYVQGQGYDSARITVVGNAVDTQELQRQLACVTADDRDELLASLSLTPDGKRIIFCGSLYENKRLDLLLPVADALYKIIPELQFIIIGGGPLAKEVEDYAALRPWVRYVGPQFGIKKALYLSLASLWVNPGLVGLGILDAFSAGLPIITTDLLIHSPEIEYLEHGKNGLMVNADITALVESISRLLQSPEELKLLQNGALETSKRYSIETMTENYAGGVLKWLRS